MHQLLGVSVVNTEFGSSGNQYNVEWHFYVGYRLVIMGPQSRPLYGYIRAMQRFLTTFCLLSKEYICDLLFSGIKISSCPDNNIFISTTVQTYSTLLTNPLIMHGQVTLEYQIVSISKVENYHPLTLVIASHIVSQTTSLNSFSTMWWTARSQAQNKYCQEYPRDHPQDHGTTIIQ